MVPKVLPAGGSFDKAVPLPLYASSRRP